ncbi:hypothetical protein TVAG_302630 [Trichomonas vaginalis G3]|uniref:DUF3447 domain-containing protein n=1 Tax=Trichomonas vaginalis (strain ATCC PRA-98 / G3) TaxID=412133 RepID=A2EGT8_TRIV3|nr:proteasome regulatory particle assembly [Trichomonas vaginalis G3]EAY08176.1 hypothetical protein TVAG_302630 [Trichomonas vaginalis G3]KAI5548692.1 proteasome regulatory particle assembly [Trichomonas vaginalis G3]|eukprot:XP_001320399.1 hypothetical protein [Trichomonas vaginalis G3]
MSDDQIDQIDYIELIDLCKCNIDSLNPIYNLKTYDNQEINDIYSSIKNNLIETQMISPLEVIHIIETASKYHVRYLNSFWALIKKFIDEYHPKLVKFDSMILNWLVYKDYGIIFNQSDLNRFKQFSNNNYSLNVHEENTIYRALMDDDKESFIPFTEIKGFDENFQFSNEFYPTNDSGYSFLELCCYHGSVNCFKFLRSKYNSKITEKCLQLSFLSGNPDIMSECLKNKTPDKACMEYAIISHNIDFVTYLMNEHNLEIDSQDCIKYHNIQAFLVYLDHTKDINQCFVNMKWLKIPALFEYLIDHGANVNFKNKEGQTALHIALENNSHEIAELLISHGANVDPLNRSRETPLFYALKNDNLVDMEFLISHGADINRKFANDKTYIHFAISHNLEVVKLLIKYGAKINAKDKEGKTPLHYAAQFSDKEMLKYLILHGADLYAKDKYSKTALNIALDFYKKDNADLLISYGARPFNQSNTKIKRYS